MPAVSPLAAIAPAPTSVGGAVSAEPGAFEQALARAGDVAGVRANAKAATRGAAVGRPAPVHGGGSDAAPADTTGPEGVEDAGSPATTQALKTTETDRETVETAIPEDGAATDATVPAPLPTVVVQIIPARMVATAKLEAATETQVPVNPALNAGQTVLAEHAEDAALTQEAAAAAMEAVEAAATTQATTSASSTAAAETTVSAQAAPMRDGSTTSTPSSRRTESRSAAAEGKTGSTEGSSRLEGISSQVRTTLADAASDGSASTLLSAQMAGQMGGQGSTDAAELASGQALATIDMSTPVAAAAPPPATVSSAVAGQTATVHGSHLAASTIETTAQLAAQIARRLDGRSTRFDMALTPDDLGRVDVSLDIDADGSLTARLAFDNPLAATELRGRADELRRQLQDAGFTVGADGLSFSERETGSSNGGSDQRFEQKAERASAGSARLNVEASAVPPAWISHSQTPQGVDLKV